ncbi:type II secretion system F family protein [Halocatena salina]|uniref:Type II secretion system F family protein n=1 Tax=Halocatena salina TaxID=2934340 RepID=A0A8U0A441_9EURY|nr:type II secretion system F family protein [Halocatena salina]UPM43579.1 type II secretion system F family protein [Halocatena salina]
MVGGSFLDRGLYALFARNADRSRHDRDRQYYRGAALGVAFDRYMARVYGVSWLVFGCVLLCSATVVAIVSTTVTGTTSFWVLGGGTIGAIGLASKRTVVLGSRYYLKWLRARRRERIEQTLPGAVRYLRALVEGSDDQQKMFQRVAAQDSYGETGVAFRRVLNHATLTGSFERGLHTVARDTPSEDLLAPFLLKFSEHARQGSDALSRYLRMESRMLSHRQARVRQQSRDFLELIAELFVVLLVLPALLVIVVSVLSVLSPRLSQQLFTPFGGISVRSALVYGSAVFVLWVGAGAAWLIGTIRPPGATPTRYDRPDSVVATVSSVPSNPASASVLAVPLAIVVCGTGIVVSSVNLVNAVLLGYVTGGIIVGGVAVRRRRYDDAKDHELRDFVHAVAGHVRLGQPFSVAVQRVAHDVDLGALRSDVNALAFRLGLVTSPDSESSVPIAALDRFVDQVGTPLAAQTVGLVTGALDAGSDADAVFETLQTEIGRLYHEKRTLKSTMTVYVVVGWTTALLIVAIMIAVNNYVLDSFAQLASVSGPTEGIGIVSGAVQPERDRFHCYVVTQSTMLACGWFAGYARAGWYEALLHSSLLVGVTYAVFNGVGMV